MKFYIHVAVLLALICGFATNGFCASSYDRELVVQDKTRAMQVESVFKEMMAAYEDEDARTFLDYVSDDRFRQDYITFTDALYNDFRNYEIHHVDYWIDRVVPDNVKQFLYVRWEKRYENLDDGRQLTQRGFSRFLFDEVDGEYLLIELAGNHLFGGSLQEWREEVPVVSGQEAEVDSEGKPDLQIISASSEYVSPSDELQFTVKNIGTSASGSCTLLATEQFPTSTIYTYPIPALEPGQSYSSGPITVNTMESLTVDLNNVVDESNENNNIFYF